MEQRKVRRYGREIARGSEDLAGAYAAEKANRARRLPICTPMFQPSGAFHDRLPLRQRRESLRQEELSTVEATS